MQKVKTAQMEEERTVLLLGAISVDEWRRVDELSALSGLSTETVARKLKKLIEQKEVEAAKFNNESSYGIHNRYRGLAAGLRAHLFSSPTVNTRTLAECWGGYTYMKKEQRAWHQ